MVTGTKTNPHALPDEMFDDSLGYESDLGLRLSPDLTPAQQARALTWYGLFRELWGVVAVRGDPGTGKDVFGNYLQYNFKRFFPWKRYLRDERPRRLFGHYDGLFNETVLAKDIAQMRSIATGVSAVKLHAELDRVANDWVRGAGEVLLKNSVLYLTEYWRYCYNREPHNPMNKLMGAIHKVKRHLDCLIIGTTQSFGELDKKTCLPWVDWRVTCVRSRLSSTQFSYFIEEVKYDTRRDMMIALPGRPFNCSFDAGKPRSDMGEGKIILRKPHYQPATEEEHIVLTALRAGVDNYEALVALLEDRGDMCESETLATLKDLGLKLPGKRPKLAIWYPCYFHLYNSKSAPQLESRIGGRK